MIVTHYGGRVSRDFDDMVGVKSGAGGGEDWLVWREEGVCGHWAVPGHAGCQRSALCSQSLQALVAAGRASGNMKTNTDL